jgi:hypothetical protein
MTIAGKIGTWTLAATLLSGSLAWGRDDETERRHEVPQAEAAVGTPYVTNRVHRVGNIGFCVTNYGFFGSQARAIRDPCTGVQAPSFEFPINSGVEYLFQGALWVGAIVGRDTLVSVGTDGWTSTQEMFPKPYPEGDIITRTTRPILRQPPNSPCPDYRFSENAVSEQDYIAVYSDTNRVGGVGGGSGEGRPMGIEVTQKSYAWSFDYAQDFILMEMIMRNVGHDTLRELYIGLYMDKDVGSIYQGAVHEDDITGFTESVESPAGELYRDTLNLAWIADNDGDPRLGQYYFASVTGVSGTRVVQAPTPNLKFSFNWWVSNSNTSRDWGPVKRDSKVPFAGNLGTPTGDKAKYAIMANGEFDYSQWEAAIDHSADGWLPPVASQGLALDLANGFDTRYLLSFGPFNIYPGDSVPLTFALVAGADFHADPRNFSSYFDPSDPAPWLSGLNLNDFARNALWAGWVYDTPGFDTDGDGYRGKYRIIEGDTAYYTGDGIPDYQGPPPPPAPAELKYTTREGQVRITWNGRRSETTKDPFSFIPDFEGYRVYMSRTLVLDDFALLSSRDNVNYVRRKFKRAANRWLVTDPPFTLDSLKVLYDSLSMATRGFPFYPDSFKVALVNLALREIVLNPIDPAQLDTNYYYFERFDANAMPDDKALTYLTDTLGHEATGVIRKLYPWASPDDSTMRLPDGTEVIWPFYEYEYIVTGLQVAEPVYLSVTAFDFGNPAADLSSLEASPLANAIEVWPIPSSEVINDTRPKPGVYPNPYRLSDDYNAAGWENPRGLEPDPERSRKLTFTNVPDTCTISIWSLDGDLVQRLDHAEDPAVSDATVAVWNMITRNTQAVKTGIYIYSIESRFGTDIGKLVIIK